LSALFSRVRARLSFANVTSSLALFVALGGTAYAQVVLPANSVNERTIRSGAVGSSEIRTGAVGRSEIKTGGVTRSEIRTDGVGANEIRSRAVGGEEIATDAVGADEVAANAVGSAEVADNAIAGSDVADGALEAADLSAAARSALTGLAFRAAVSPAGTLAGGNAANAARSAAGVYAVGFGRDVSACQVAATLAATRTGTTVDQPAAGIVTVGVDPASPAGLIVRTFDAAGVAADRPFHVLVAC
jgi:hypothetical protein